MTWHISKSLRCLLEPGEESSGGSCLAGEQSAPSKSSPTAAKSSCGGKMKGTSKRSPYGTTCERLTELSGAGAWMLSLADSPVSRTPSLEGSLASTIPGIYGRTPSESFAKVDAGLRCCKMSQGSLAFLTLGESSPIWPKAALMRGGVLYRLEPVEPATTAPAYGFWLSTPCASEGKDIGKASILARLDRGGRVARNICARHWLTRSEDAMVFLNPYFAEWMMDFPIGWTGLGLLGTGKTREWRQQHGAFLADIE